MVPGTEQSAPALDPHARTGSPPQLSVRLFGGLLLSRSGVELPPFPTRKSAALFWHLVLRRSDSIPREVLCARLWGNQPDKLARKSLRTALWRVRSVLESDDRPPCLCIDTHRIGFRPESGAAVDVWSFLDVAEAVDRDPGEGPLTDEELVRITRATALYRGDLLEGESNVDDWTFLEVERLRLLQVVLLERLMAHHSANVNWRCAASIGDDILRLDPCREHVHREVMGCYAAMGDRPSAVRQFHKCAEQIYTELDIQPMPETLDLYNRIRAGDVGSRTLPLDRRRALLGASW